MFVYPNRCIPDQPVTLPAGLLDTRLEPEHYTPGREVANAVNVALLLRKPLLLTGEAGVGKTELAYHVAWALRLPPPLVFQAKTTSVARDLFYSIDEIARLRSTGDAEDKTRHIRFFALGEAILGSHGPDSITENLKSRLPSWAPQSVVLIDEVDKAPRDFPNDILRELDKLEFDVPEVSTQPIAATATRRPIVIVTSNSERTLPPPFLRRCIYCHIPFPSDDVLLNILRTRMQIADAKREALSELVAVFLRIREMTSELARVPSTAELLDWLHFVHATTGLERTGIKANTAVFLASSNCLGKTEKDVRLIESVLSQWIAV